MHLNLRVVSYDIFYWEETHSEEGVITEESHLDEMVVTAEVLVASWIAGSILFLALAGFCSALGPASALEHPLPIVHAVEPCRLPHANFQLRDIVDGEQLLVTEGEPVSCKVCRDSALPRKKKMTKVKLKIKMKMMKMMVMIKKMMMMMGCTQIPISTLSHIWVFVRLYGIVFVIIVIIIIIIMIIKSEGVNAQL